MSALITREPKQDLKLIKSRVLKGVVRFGHLSVTLSNGWSAKKCVGSTTHFWSNSDKTIGRSSSVQVDSAPGHQTQIMPCFVRGIFFWGLVGLDAIL